MRTSYGLALLSTVAFSTMVHAQTGVDPAAAAPAAAHYTVADTDVGTLLDDPASKAVLVKYLPELVNSPQIDMARSLTLKTMQGFAPDKLSDDTLTKIDADLAKLPVKK